jgi:hypothetical protein
MQELKGTPTVPFITKEGKNYAYEQSPQGQPLQGTPTVPFVTVGGQNYAAPKITADSLQPAVALKTPTQPLSNAPGFQAQLETLPQQYTAEQQAEQQRQEDLDAKQSKDKSLTSLYEGIMGQQGEVALSDQAYQQEGVDTAKNELNQINNQMIQEQVAIRRQVEEIQKNPTGMLAGGIQAEVNRATRESLSKQADLAVIQMAKQGQYDSAKEIADRKVAIQLEAQKQKMDADKFFYQEHKEEYTKAEQRQYEARMLKDDRQYEDNKATLQTISNLALEYLKNGGDTATAQKIMRSGSLEEAAGLASFAVARTAAIPTTREINGETKQWNPDTGRWESIGTTAAMDGETRQKAIDQLTFLQETAKSAEKLATASGPNWITKTSGDIFVGDSDYRQLENLVKTLQTNMLTVATDPGIKKFFGPQMTENDVRMMIAGGTTLNTASQSPTALKAEINRLKLVFNKLQTAAQNGTSAADNLVTAPNGEIIQIID